MNNKYVKDQIEEVERNFIHRFIGHYKRDDYYKIHPHPACKPIVIGEYNGTRNDFECVIYNLTSSHRLREYGLLHEIPFVLKNVIDVFDEEQLCNIGEFHLVHCGTELITMKNLAEGKSDEVLRFDVGDYFTTKQKESCLVKHSPLAYIKAAIAPVKSDSHHHAKMLLCVGLIVSGAAIVASICEYYTKTG